MHDELNMKDWITRPERRNYHRLDVDLNVDITIDGQKISATATNVSCGGMFIPIKRSDIQDKENIKLSVTLPDSTKPLNFRCDVKRYQEKNENEAEGVGLQFQGLYDENMLEIDRFIKTKLH